MAITVSDIQLAVLSYYDIQRPRVAHQLRCKSLVKRGIVSSENKAEDLYHLALADLLSAEAKLRRLIDETTADHPVRTTFLRRVRGIGPVLSGGIIAAIERRCQVMARLTDGREQWVTHPDLYPNEGAMKRSYKELGVKTINKKLTRRSIGCFDNIAKLWSYFGLGVIEGHAPKKKKGQKLNFPTSLARLSFLIGDCLMKQGRSYRKVFDQYRDRQKIKYPAPEERTTASGKKFMAYTDPHFTRMARRYTAKMLLSHVWTCWRELEKLPMRKPYPIEYLGHTTVLSWRDFLDRDLTEPEVDPEPSETREGEGEDGEIGIDRVPADDMDEANWEEVA